MEFYEGFNTEIGAELGDLREVGESDAEAEY